jgi:hypothetical protein
MVIRAQHERIRQTYGHIDGEEGEPNEGEHIAPFGALRPVSEGENETH